MATAFNGTALATTEQDLFNADTDGGPCTSFVVYNVDGNRRPFEVNIPGLHAASQWFPVLEQQTFTYERDGIRRVRARAVADAGIANAGASKVSGGVVTRMNAPVTAP